MPTPNQNSDSDLVELIARMERLLSKLDSLNLQTAAIHIDIAICELCEIAKIDRQK